MPSLTLVLPFALPPQAHARDLIAQLRLPALSKLLSRAKRTERHAATEHSALNACLPHEQWLSGHTIDRPNTLDTSPPLAHALMQQLGSPPPRDSGSFCSRCICMWRATIWC